jgi:hypothetical protein
MCTLENFLCCGEPYFEAVMGTATKLAYIKLGSFFNFHLDYFQNNFLEYLVYCRHEAKLKLNSVALVRKRTIPTERPPLSAK